MTGICTYCTYNPICEMYLHGATQPKLSFMTTQAFRHFQGVVHYLLLNMSTAAHLNCTLKCVFVSTGYQESQA